MVPKIIAHAVSVVAENKMDRVQALGRGTRLKSKRHSPPASLLGSSTKVPATRLERRTRTAQSNRTEGYVAHFRKNHRILLLGNWNVLTLTGKELELVEEAKKCYLDIVGVSSTKRRGSGIIDLDVRWKLFYLGADPSMSAQVGVGIFTSPQLSDCVFDWITLGSPACMLKLKIKDRSLCLLQVCASNAGSKYQAFVDFVDDVNNAFQRVESTESTILMGEFNANIGTDSETRKSVIAKRGDPAFNENSRYLLQLCFSNRRCIMNIFLQHRDVHKYSWYKPSILRSL